jgi:hypothetical protein
MTELQTETDTRWFPNRRTEDLNENAAELTAGKVTE